MAVASSLAKGAACRALVSNGHLSQSRHRRFCHRLPVGSSRNQLYRGAICTWVGSPLVLREQRPGVVRAAAAAPASVPDPQPVKEFHTVGDAMTRGGLIAAKVTTTVDEALEALVENRITGMPVVDDKGRLVGVVSDYDLLALDTISGPRRQPDDKSMFPAPDTNWKAFKEIQKLMLKTRGKTVGDVMTPHPLAVRPFTNLEDAARLLLESKYRRLPVVDDNGRLVGILTRGNVVKAALESRRSTEMKPGTSASGSSGLAQEF